MDTAKAANLCVLQVLIVYCTNLIFPYRFTVYKDADLMDFINAPIGKGLPIQDKLRPLIAGTFFGPYCRFCHAHC